MLSHPKKNCRTLPDPLVVLAASFRLCKLMLSQPPLSHTHPSSGYQMWFTWLCNSYVYFCLIIPMPKLAFAREANNLIFSQQMPRILLLSMLTALFSILPDKKYIRISLSRFRMSPVSTCWRHNARFLERKMHHKSYFASFAIRLPFKSLISGNSQGSVLDLCNIRQEQ